jgi:DNA-binding NtrC family response regulator
MEKELIKETLRKFNGNRRKTAKALKISERTLYRKLHEYGLS